MLTFGILKHAGSGRMPMEKTGLLKHFNRSRQVASIEDDIEIPSISDDRFIHLRHPELYRVSTDCSVRNLRRVQSLSDPVKSIFDSFQSPLNPLLKGITRVFDRNHLVTSSRTIIITTRPTSFVPIGFPHLRCVDLC